MVIIYNIHLNTPLFIQRIKIIQRSQRIAIITRSINTKAKLVNPKDAVNSVK